MNVKGETMVNSRKIEDLHPAVQVKCRRFLAECEKSGIDVIITSTYRDAESQNALYAQGRTLPGNIVTNARSGQSWHNWCVAFDVVPLRNGKPVWGTSGKDGELWQSIGAVGRACGLEWAGDWKGKLIEFAHFQYTGGLSLADFKAGKTLQVVA
jgi:peptidoglycan LD-endopeptidase CwlK